MNTTTPSGIASTMAVALLATIDAVQEPEVLDICHQLGYGEVKDDNATRGPPTLLLEEILALMNTHQWIRDSKALADISLNQPPAGLRHNYFVYAGPLPANYLAWRNDWQRCGPRFLCASIDFLIMYRIRELVTSLFRIIIEGRKAHSSVVESDDEAETNTALTVYHPSPVEVNHHSEKDTLLTAFRQPSRVEQDREPKTSTASMTFNKHDSTQRTRDLAISVGPSAGMDMSNAVGQGPLTR